MTNDGSIHCLGNGKLCVYEQGADIVQVFGPPYSAPDLGRLLLDPPDEAAAMSEREAGSAIWTHTLPSARLTDFVDARLPCLVRRVRASSALRFRLELHPSVRVAVFSSQDDGQISGLTCEIPPGTFFYAHYPYPRPVFYQVAWRGALSVQRTGDAAFQITCEPGESWLVISGGPEYPQAVESCAAALAETGEALLTRTRASWQAFTSDREDWSARLPLPTPQRERLLRAIDDTAVLIKTQQAREGGVLAGHNYHLCYVRDQFGVSRGLLAMGHLAEARAILEFYWGIWQRYGRIHNAQGVGIDGLFHIHENDEVEITGYLVLQAFDLQERTRDEAFTRMIFPMLAWAFEAQKKHLIGYMLPFNGDETYVAGGILPRTALNDGSAEATLLFLEGGTRLVQWADRSGLWSWEKTAAERALLAVCQAAYRANFMRGGELATNNPERATLPGSLPAYRHGVCERCIAEGRMEAIGWTQRSPAGRYLCPRCLSEGEYTPYTPRRYTLQSVSLTPLYFHAQMPSKPELQPTVDSILAAYHLTGRLPSRPDDERGLAVGYDYGFLLYALAELDHPGALEIYEKTLALVDSSGAWVEYYIDHQPSGTRCRPWESAVNLEALLRWAMR